jgi:hypothetical protein
LPRRLAVTVALVGAALAGGTLHADSAAAEESFPRLEGELSVEVQGDHVYKSDDAAAELTDIYTTTEPYLRARLTRELSLETGLVLEPIRDPAGGNDRFFGDHGLYVEQLFLNYETDAFALYAGKYNPSFGAAWDIAPGIYGADFAEDYELTERVGLGGAVTFGGAGIGGDGFGAHRLAVNGFFADTSVLSESVLNNRGRTHESDGGVSNTEDLSSFSVTLDGGDFEGLEGIGYTLGVERQEGGQGDPRDELGVVAGVNASLPLSEQLVLEPMVEVAYIDNAEGAQQDRSYLTAGAALLQGPWNLSLSYTRRDTSADGAGLTDSSDDLFQASVGYAFDFGLGLDVGYRYAEEDKVDTHAVGFLVSYGVEFELL